MSSHPAKRNLMTFMRSMIVDSLSLPPSQKNSPVIDLLLNAKPESTTHAQQCRQVVVLELFYLQDCFVIDCTL